MTEEPIPLPPDAPPELKRLLDWFQSSVARLEGAYSELGHKFEQVNRELEITNANLVRALREKEHTQKQLGALLDSIDTGVLMVDTTSSIQVFNRSAERLLGLSAADALGRKVDEVFKDGSGVGEELAQAGLASVMRERILQGHGGSFPAACATVLVQDQSGRPLGAVETFSDLTAIKRMQAEVQQDRVLRALGEMAATVAHEIRNPLAGIGGYAGLLARGIPADDARRKLVDRIIQGVSSLNKIVTNLLVYTRKTHLQRMDLDLLEWFEAVLAHAELEIEREGRHIVIVRDFPPNGQRALVDPERFQQVALNLLFNAIQAIGDSGEIRVGIGTEPDGRVRVLIGDTGCGIPEADLQRIFTPFYTTREQGTGLGLAIVRKLVELHEGEIDVASAPGQGTTFRILLPAPA